MQEIGYVEVETASIDDLARGLREDMDGMRLVIELMRDNVTGLGPYWSNAQHDAFEEGFLEDHDHLDRSFKAFQNVVLALEQTVNYYGELEQLLDEELPNL